ncbi:MAG: biotin--[Ruminococcus sp.]|nr:biotin--[acetyl-CoA-carboxylase] ligase [Ruminococcus sp.]
MNNINKLSAERIAAFNKWNNMEGDILIFDELTSTNIYAKELAAKGAAHGTTVIADYQTGGKGRLGRSFESPSGAGLYMSVIIRPDFDISLAPMITSAVAVAAAEAVEKLCGEEIRVKWVNDLYLNSRKICGILTEAALNPTLKKLDYAVIGIGINVRKCEFPKEIKDIATSVEAETGKITDRNVLCGEILGRLGYYIENMEKKAHLGEYRRRELLTGNYITANTGGEAVEGYAVGIDDNANLILLLSDGSEKSLVSGEANLCRIRGDNK